MCFSCVDISVFAPQDSAFDDLLPTTLVSKLLSDPSWRAHLDHLLLHHAMAIENNRRRSLLSLNALLQDDTAGGENGVSLKMASGEFVTLTRGSDGGNDVLLDGHARVTLADVSIYDGDGTVHVIDGLLRPQFLSTTVAAFLSGSTSSSTHSFEVLISMAGLSNLLSSSDVTVRSSASCTTELWWRRIRLHRVSHCPLVYR